MADVNPTDLFGGYTFDGTSITIPLADLPAFSETEASAEYGDAREMIRAFTEAAFQRISALPTEAKPTRMAITKSNPVGTQQNIIRQSYTLTFEQVIDPNQLRVRDEVEG